MLVVVKMKNYEITAVIRYYDCIDGKVQEELSHETVFAESRADAGSFYIERMSLDDITVMEITEILEY